MLCCRCVVDQFNFPTVFNVSLVFFYYPASSVVQQAAAVRTHSDLQVGEYVDLEVTSAWTDQQWSEEIIENQVITLYSLPSTMFGSLR